MNTYLQFKPSNDDIDLERINRFQKYLTERKPTVCYQRAKIITEVYRNNQNKSWEMKKALALKALLSEMDVYLEEDSLIIGNQASRNFAAPVFPEYSFNWLIKELDELGKRSGDFFLVDEETKSELRALQDFWQGITHQDEVNRNLPAINLEAEKQGVLHRGGISMSGDGHIVPNHQLVLERGFIGVKKVAEDKLGNPNLSESQKDFYQAVMISMDAANIYIQRLQDLARGEAEKTNSTKRKLELVDMVAMLQEILDGEIKSFYAGVEAIYLVHLIMMIESNGHSFSFGRFDQYMYDLYRHDIASGVISKEKALEIITHFFLKNNTLNKIRPWGHTQFSGGYPLYSNLMVGGLRPDGTDGTNEITYLCMEAMNLTRLPEPNFSLRFNKDTPHDLMLLTAKLIRTGFGQPSIFADEVCIPAMMSVGIDEVTARDYASMGCVEIGIAGKSGHRATGMTYVNFGKIIELVINNGVDPRNGIQLINFNGQAGRDIEFTSYQEVWQAWKQALKFYSDLAYDCDLVCDRSLKKHDADTFASALTDDCLGRGKTLKNGGGEYDFISASNIGPSVVGDSLAAIKKLIFEEKKFTFSQLRAILDANFAGENGAFYRAMMKKAPKFGNDDDYVDAIVADVYESYLEIIKDYKTDRYLDNPKMSGYIMSTSNITSYVPNGFDVGATPDGRLATMPLNEGASPCLGADRQGPTAVINSVGKLPNKKMAGGQLLNMRFAPGALAGDENLEKFTYFIESGAEKNIFHNQFNVVDSETLKKAKERPEDYPDLMVRVAGYCALFVTLMPEAQDAIIARSELGW